jgi:hypothetical protein
MATPEVSKPKRTTARQRPVGRNPLRLNPVPYYLSPVTSRNSNSLRQNTPTRQILTYPVELDEID